MMRDRKGFTLVELIVVIAILSILAFLIVPQMTRHVGQSQTVVCESNRATVMRDYQMKHAQDDSVTLESVLASHPEICPDPKGVVTIGSDGESLICSIHGGSTAGTSGVIETLQEFIDSYAGKDLDADAVKKAARAKRFQVTSDLLSAASDAAEKAGVSNPEFPSRTMYWGALVVQGADGKPAIAMLASTSGNGVKGYLLYYNEHLYCYQKDGKTAQGQMADGASIDDYLPGGKNASADHGWILVS